MPEPCSSRLSQPYAPLLTVLAHPGLRAWSRAAPGPTVRRGCSDRDRIASSRSQPGRIVLEAQPEPLVGRAAYRAHRVRGRRERRARRGRSRCPDSRRLVPVGTAPAQRGRSLDPGPTRRLPRFQAEHEPFLRRRIRQAVAAGIDPAALGAVLDRVAIPLQSFLPPGVWARREGSPILERPSAGGQEAPGRGRLAPRVQVHPGRASHRWRARYSASRGDDRGESRRRRHPGARAGRGRGGATGPDGQRQRHVTRRGGGARRRSSLVALSAVDGETGSGRRGARAIPSHATRRSTMC